MATEYVEHPPHPALARHVECYWTLRAHLPADDPRAESVLPDGCMDILFSLGDAPRTGQDSDAGPSVVGTMTRALRVAYGGDVSLVGVRFRPGGATPYVTLPASEVTDAAMPLEAVWGPDAAELAERIALAPGPDARVALLDSELRRRLERAGRHLDEGVLHASEAVARTGGRMSVDDLAESAGVGRRQLERRFLAAVGLPPKVACRVARFRSAVAGLQRGSSASLARVALDAGYADQAHFTREFKALAGITPGAYLRTRSGEGG